MPMQSIALPKGAIADLEKTILEKGMTWQLVPALRRVTSDTLGCTWHGQVRPWMLSVTC